MSRATQRQDTRKRIVEAAVEVFAERGFDGASTRLIAGRAGVTQGLVTYHYPAKDELWRSAADHVFGILAGSLDDSDGGGRKALRRYVEVSAAHPEIFHFLVDAGRHDDERMRWLVDTHLRPRYDDVRELAGRADGPGAASLYYALVGAVSFFFAVGPESRRLTGVDPTDAVEAHVELLTALFDPE